MQSEIFYLHYSARYELLKNSLWTHSERLWFLSIGRRVNFHFWIAGPFSRIASHKVPLYMFRCVPLYFSVYTIPPLYFSPVCLFSHWLIFQVIGIIPNYARDRTLVPGNFAKFSRHGENRDCTGWWLLHLRSGALWTFPWCSNRGVKWSKLTWEREDASLGNVPILLCDSRQTDWRPHRNLDPYFSPTVLAYK